MYLSNIPCVQCLVYCVFSYELYQQLLEKIDDVVNLIISKKEHAGLFELTGKLDSKLSTMFVKTVCTNKGEL